MVHFREYDPIVGNGSGPAGDYWKLERPRSAAFVRSYFINKGIAYRVNSPRVRLFALYARVQRGLPIYDKYTLEELRASYFQRYHQLPTYLPVRKNAMRLELIRLLEDRTYEDGFHKLMDLPAELRVQIYEHYFKDVMTTIQKSTAGFFAQPPVTYASKLLRKEALDVFFKCCTPTIVVGQRTYIWHHQLWDAKTKRFLKDAPVDHVHAIQNLRIRGWLHCPTGRYLAGNTAFGEYLDFFTWQIRVDQPDLRIEWSRERSACHLEFTANFEKLVQKFIRARTDPDGRFRLQRGDEEALPAMLNAL